MFGDQKWSEVLGQESWYQPKLLTISAQSHLESSIGDSGKITTNAYSTLLFPRPYMHSL